jgi:hypothetical protein
MRKTDRIGFAAHHPVGKINPRHYPPNVVVYPMKSNDLSCERKAWAGKDVLTEMGSPCTLYLNTVAVDKKIDPCVDLGRKDIPAAY